MGPFTERLIYPLSPARVPSPPVLLLGNKSVARSSATCTERPPHQPPRSLERGDRPRLHLRELGKVTGWLGPGLPAVLSP